MRLAFVSDIHGNLPAWRGVWADITSCGFDRVICLGDVVGYGPFPAEVLSEVYANVHHLILGNHDAVIAGVKGAEGFNPGARALIEWTAGRLDSKARSVLAGFPLLLRSKELCCVHGSMAEPSAFHYILNEESARRSWQACQERLTFVGHTHIPRLHQLDSDGVYRRFSPPTRPFKLVRGARYIINSGSVGLPRAGDGRASWLLYDQTADTVEWRAVAYDTQAYTDAVHGQLQEPASRAFILNKMKHNVVCPVRDPLDFTPLSDAIADSVCLERAVSLLGKNALQRWGMVALFLFSLLFGGVVSVWIFPGKAEAVQLKGSLAERFTLAHTPAGRRVSLLPKASSTDNRPPPGWRYHLSDGAGQTVAMVGGHLLIQSGRKNLFLEVMTPEINLSKAIKITINMKGRVGEGYTGAPPTLIVDYLKRDGTLKADAVNGRLVLRGCELSKQMTLASLPKRIRGVRLRLSGNFSGQLTVTDWCITPR